MEVKRKCLRGFIGISILLTFVFMVITLWQFQKEEEMPMPPKQLEVYYDEGWTVISLDGGQGSEAGFENHDRIKGLVEEKLAEGTGEKVRLPYAGSSKTGEIIVYQNTLPGEYAGLTLSFSTSAIVRVVFDGEIIYEYGIEGEPEKISEDHENLISIPNVFQEGELWIELTSLYPDAAATLSEVKLETRDMVVIGLVGSNIVDIGCCLLIVFMAIIMFVLALIRHYTRQPVRGELFLGLAGLAAGIYCFIETDTLDLFYDVQEAYVLQEYFVLLIPLLLTLYFERNLYLVFPRRFFVLSVCVCVNVMAQLLLYRLDMCDLEDMTTVSAVVVGAVCVVAVVSLIQFDYTNRQYQTLLSVISLLVLLSGGSANVIMNVICGDARGNSLGQYSMTVFGVMMAVVHILQMSKEYRASAEEKVKVTERQNAQLTQARKEADAARQEALAANEAKGKFLAHMSHEIRTPINAVLGMDEMILRESREQNVKEYAMDIYTAGQTLLSLINDILDFSKIESGKMEIVPVEYDVSSLIHDLANMAMRRAADKNIKLQVEVDHEIPSQLYGDDVRIRQVLTNILTNAVKYTHEGTVWLRVQGCKTGGAAEPQAQKCGAGGEAGPQAQECGAGGEAEPQVQGAESGETAVLRFEVEDTGIGIKEEDLPKLSAEFERIEEDRNRNIEGSGLGMSITIQLLELLGSRLRVNSVYGQGSKFYFELKQKIVDHTPVGDFEARVGQIAENYNYNAKVVAPDAKILVVDDNAVNRKVLRNLLKETQIQVTEAEKGMECLELVQKNHYDLIFLDHMMPEMDGVETLHRIKVLVDYPCRNTPIIVLTANAVSGAKEKYLSEGFDDFLSKPIVPQKLESMIQRMLPEELQQQTAGGEGLRQRTTSDQEIWQQTVGGGELGQKEVNDKELWKTATEHGKAGASPQMGTNACEDVLDALPQVDGLDWQYAWLHLPDMELLEYTVKEFYAQIDSAAGRLERAYEQAAESRQPGQVLISQQLEQYRIQVHAMKSLAATVGITPLAGMAKVLEYAARDGKIDVVTSMTAIFLDEWRGYSQKLQGVFGIENAVKKEVADYSVMQALVEMVRMSMGEMDVDQADQLMGQLRAYEYPDEIEQDMQAFGEAVTNLDVEEVNRLADQLIGRMAGTSDGSVAQ